MAITVGTVVGTSLLAWLTVKVGAIFYDYFLHPLARFPGPNIVATGWYKTSEEIFKGRNWLEVLEELHKQYGSIVRVGPNELHFSRPASYHEIYNNANRWDKEESLYHSFGEDNSSFGFLTFREAKQRKDVLAPLFSRKSITEAQSVIWQNAERFCEALGARDAQGKSSDMLFGLRCFTLDTILTLCFAKDVRATGAPDFKAPIVVAMDASLPAFPLFRHFSFIRRMVFSFPGWLTRLSNPALGGLVDLQELLGTQVTEVVANPALLDKTAHPTIYHRLLDPEVNKATGVPSATSLYEEAQALMFGGAESSGNVTMIGIWHVLQNPEILARLMSELKAGWPNLQARPALEELEKLPYLTAIIKESLRMSPSVPAPLPRIVPSPGAMIDGQMIPAGTIVGMSLTFVHASKDVFAEPSAFVPERWLGTNARELERWFVPFSKGPRACLGVNLAMAELYVAFATMFRKFDIKLDRTRPGQLAWKECFLPSFNTHHMRAFCTPAPA